MTTYIAAVSIPKAHRADTDTISSAWRNIGYYTSKKAAENACKNFIAKLELEPELDGRAEYYVTSTGRLNSKPPFIQKLISRNPPQRKAA